MIEVGNDIVSKVNEALLIGCPILLCVSPAYLVSRWASHERSVALARRLQSDDPPQKIIPLLLGATQVSEIAKKAPMLASLRFLDQNTMEAAASAILACINSFRTQASRPEHVDISVEGYDSGKRYDETFAGASTI